MYNKKEPCFLKRIYIYLYKIENMKKVYQFTADGKLVGEYKSIAEAGRAVGITEQTISMVVNGKRNTAKGYIWSFKNELDVSLIQDDDVWMPIKGFGDRYEISNTDRVRAKRKVFKDRVMPPKEISVCVDNVGYKACCLDGVSYRIHRLKYEAFVGEIPEGMVVDHINRNRLDNRLENLRLVDQPMNVKNRTLAYKPDIQDCSKYQVYKNKEKAHQYLLRFTENGKRIRVGYFQTYEEAENKYRELYNERQKRIDYACS